MSRRQKPSDPNQRVKAATVVARLKAQRETRRAKVLQAWEDEEQRQKRRQLDDQYLRELCLIILANPDLLIIDRMPPLSDDPDYSCTAIPGDGMTCLRPYFVYQLIQAFVAMTKQTKPLSQQETANLVDCLVDETKMTLTDARRRVAAQLHRTEEAVAQSHRRYGRHKGRRKTGDIAKPDK
jgi:hypothetical protein